MTASAWWIDGPLIWLLVLAVFVLLLFTNCARRERQDRKMEAAKPLAPIIPLPKRKD